MTINLTPSVITLTAKDPADVTDYLLDFSNVIPNDSITGTPQVAIIPAGLTLGVIAAQPGVGGANKAVAVRLSGGSVYASYNVQATIQTVAGDTFARSILLPVLAR